MKTLFTFSFFLCCVVTTYAQFQFSLTVLDTKGHQMANQSVSFIEKSTFERINYKTDASGMVSLVFDHGDLWAGTVGEMYGCFEVGTGAGRPRSTS